MPITLFKYRASSCAIAIRGRKTKKRLENSQKMIEERFHNDWPWLGRYKEDNARLPQANTENRVGFIGDSITDGWDDIDPSFLIKTIL